MNHREYPNLNPLSDLTQGNQKKLFQGSQSERLPPRSLLQAVDEQEWLTYLLEGELTILESGFVKEKICGGAPRSEWPVFGENQPEARAVTQLGARIIQINKSLYERLQQEENAARLNIAEIELTDEENSVFGELYMAFVNGNLQIPNFPDVALKVRAAINDNRVTVSELSQIVQADPVLAARLMKVVNSPLYRGWKTVGNLRDAIQRLGLEATRTLAITLAMKQLFKAKTQHIRQYIKEVYQHSTFVSAIAYVLAQRVKTADPERALLAGLLSRIGAIPILNFLDENPSLFSSQAELDHCLQKLQGPIGGILLGHWGFDAELITVAEECEIWSRQSGQEEPDYCDIVTAALWHSYLTTSKQSQLPSFQSVPALSKPALNLLDPEEENSLLEEAHEEIEIVHNLLQT